MAGRGEWIRRALDASVRRGEPTEASQPAPAPEPTIAPGCEIQGDLRLEGPLTVHGDFQGSIHCAGDVVVAPEGTVQGPIVARSVEVEGSVVGSLDARREVWIRAGGRLHGDVRAPSLVVERGATFQGRSERTQPIALRPAPAAVVQSSAAGDARKTLPTPPR